MTKKDYIKFANMIKRMKKSDIVINNKQYQYFIDAILIPEMSNIFFNDNYNFDLNRFRTYIEDDTKFYKERK